jgi:hypothetical protein
MLKTYLTTVFQCFAFKTICIFSFIMVSFFVGKAQNTSFNGDLIPIGGTNSVAVGNSSLTSNTAPENTAVGKSALQYNTIGSFNTAVGYATLFQNISGRSNCAFGHFALVSNTSGHQNTALGQGSLSQTNAFGNSGVGCNALSGNTTGEQNIAFGYQAGTHNYTGNNNCFLGVYSSPLYTNLSNSTALGYNAIVNYSDAIQLGNGSVTQIFAGVGTTAKLITGGLQVTGGTLVPGYVLTSDNVGNATWQAVPGGPGTVWELLGNAGVPDDALHYLGTQDASPLNFRVNGDKAGRIETGITYFGLHAGNTNTGKFSTGVGFEALASLNNGDNNTAIGYAALQSNTDGAYNVAVGENALTSNITGEENTAMGYNSLFSNRTGNINCAYGIKSLYSNATGGGNNAFGLEALYTNNGDGNNAIGNNALSLNTTGNFNVGFGYRSMISNITGSYNTGLGSLTDVSGTVNNASAVGYNAIVNTSDKIRLGDASVTIIETALATMPSDGRFKFNIKEEDVKGLEFINRLRPVVYNFDTKKFQQFLTKNMPDSLSKKYFEHTDFTKSTGIRQSGFIAQEVEIAEKETGYDFNGLHKPENENDNYSIAYGQFVVPLVKSVQELSRQNDSLKKEIAEIKAMIIANAPARNINGSIKIIESNESAKLFQNAPNPFTKTTTIKYSLPAYAKKAVIVIINSTGAKLKEYDLKAGGQSLDINGGQLSPGIYFYSLYVDDELIDSKQMILTK